KQVAFRMCVGKTPLENESQVFIEAPSVSVTGRHDAGNAAHLQLFERVVEAEPQELAIQPSARAIGRDVHVHVRAVPAFVENATDDLTGPLQADSGAQAGHPLPFSALANPGTESVVLAYDYLGIFVDFRHLEQPP